MSTGITAYSLSAVERSLPGFKFISHDLEVLKKASGRLWGVRQRIILAIPKVVDKTRLIEKVGLRLDKADVTVAQTAQLRPPGNMTWSYGKKRWARFAAFYDQWLIRLIQNLMFDVNLSPVFYDAARSRSMTPDAPTVNACARTIAKSILVAVDETRPLVASCRESGLEPITSIAEFHRYGPGPTGSLKKHPAEELLQRAVEMFGLE